MIVTGDACRGGGELSSTLMMAPSLLILLIGLEFELTRSHLTLGKHSFATVLNSTGNVLVMLHAIKVETLTSQK